MIEGSRPLRLAMVNGLSAAGHAVDAVGDGAAGWRQLREAAYDLVVLDMQAPGGGGEDLLYRLRRSARSTQVLALTTRFGLSGPSSPGPAGPGLDGPGPTADDHLVKPFVFPELQARIRTLLHRAQEARVTMLQVGDLTIDTARQCVMRGSEELPLTRCEYRLLALLARHHGAPVSRRAIRDQLYTRRLADSSNVVDVYIGYLRRKIERPGQPRLIHTRRGVGYLLGTL